MGDRVAVLRDGCAAAARRAAGALRSAGQPVRRVVHGLPVDEPLRRVGRRTRPVEARLAGARRSRPGGPRCACRSRSDGRRRRRDPPRASDVPAGRATARRTQLVADVELVEALGNEQLVHFADRRDAASATDARPATIATRRRRGRGRGRSRTASPGSTRRLGVRAGERDHVRRRRRAAPLLRSGRPAPRWRRRGMTARRSAAPSSGSSPGASSSTATRCSRSSTCTRARSPRRSTPSQRFRCASSTSRC